MNRDSCPEQIRRISAPFTSFASDRYNGFMAIACPSCSSQLMLASHLEGRRVKCPKCAAIFEAPVPTVDVETVDEREPEKIPCPSCAGPLALSDAMRGKQVRCPRCQAIFTAPTSEKKEPEAAYQITAAPLDDDAPLVVEPDTLAVLPPTVEAKSKRREREDFMEEIEENLPPRETKREKRERLQQARRHLPQNASWTWWAFGGGGILAFQLAVIIFALVAPTRLLQAYGIYLFFSVPIGTVVFIGAMWLASMLFGAVDIGELQVTVVKAYIIVAIANIAGLTPYGGFFLSIVVWYAGIMICFKLDLWETRVLVAVNWALNFGVRMAIVLTLASGPRLG
jgi:predicted Zn finger-like uncharacterized protein